MDRTTILARTLNTLALRAFSIERGAGFYDRLVDTAAAHWGIPAGRVSHVISRAEVLDFTKKD